MTGSFEEDFTKAASLVRERNHVDAIGIYTTIATHDSATINEKVRAYSNQSACYAAREQYKDALDAAKKALELDEKNSKVHGRLATAYHGLKHYEEAAQHYKRANELDPSNSFYLQQYQAVLLLIRDGKGIASQETKDAYYYRKGIEQGKEAMTKGEYLSAVRHFSKAIELHKHCATETNNNNNNNNNGTNKLSDLAVLLCNRSAAYSRLSRYAESLEDAMKAAEVHPMYARAFFRIAHAQHQLKHPNEAYTALRRCLELDPTHNDAKSLIAEVEQVVADLKKTAEEKQREKEEQVREIREMQNAERITESMQSGSSAGYRGRAHATSYTHCGYCNDPGHSRAECPLLRRKRSRTS